jgi:hypothetical protein
MKCSANFIEYKIQPFLVENNTKNPNIYKWQKWLAFLVDVLFKIIYMKITISHVTYARMWLHNFFMYIYINK